MTTPFASQIVTCRVRGVPEASPALRLRADRLVGGLDLQLRSLPPSSLLVVARLVGPGPRALSHKMAPRRPEAGWRDALRERIDAEARDAARPCRGRVPAGARAVVFADLAEFLACLAVRCPAPGTEDWWWRWLVRRRPDLLQGGVAGLLDGAIERAPAVLAHLHAWGDLATVLEPIDERAAAELLRRMVAALALPLPLPETAAAHEARSAPPRQRTEPSPREADPEAAHAATAPAPPWALWLRPEDAPRGVAREALAGVGVGLGLHPAAVRRPSFAARLTGWWRARLEAAAGDPAPRSDRRPPAMDGEVVRRHGPEFPPPATREDGVPVALRQPPPPGRSPAPVAPAGSREAAPRPDATIAEVAVRTPRPAAGPAPSPPARREEARPPIPTAPPGLDVRAPVTTRLGGVFYLLNLFASLDVPASFEDDWRLASRATTWAVLETVARTLLARAWPEVADDPVWSVLAELDGRTGDVSSADVAATCAYRLPAAWRHDRPAPAAPLRWAASRRRLSLWSRAGYLLFDGPRDGRPPTLQATRLAAALATETERPRRDRLAAAPIARNAGALPPGWSRGLAAWAGRATPYLAARVEAAAGAAPSADMALLAGLLRLPARLHLTATHVDVVASVDHVALPARVAGLDRDPGWLPRCGRVVQLHFD